MNNHNEYIFEVHILGPLDCSSWDLITWTQLLCNYKDFCPNAIHPYEWK